MTAADRPARHAVYGELMWPDYNPTTESHGTSEDKANALLDAHEAEVRAAVTSAPADRAATDELAALRARIAELEQQIAIDTQVTEKADRECDEHISAGRAFRQLAERTQAWGEHHRDRANRYRARVERVRALHEKDGGVCSTCADETGQAAAWPCPTIRALRADPSRMTDEAPQSTGVTP